MEEIRISFLCKLRRIVVIFSEIQYQILDFTTVFITCLPPVLLSIPCLRPPQLVELITVSSQLHFIPLSNADGFHPFGRHRIFIEANGVLISNYLKIQQFVQTKSQKHKICTRTFLFFQCRQICTMV